MSGLSVINQAFAISNAPAKFFTITKDDLEQMETFFVTDRNKMQGTLYHMWDDALYLLDPKRSGIAKKINAGKEIKADIESRIQKLNNIIVSIEECEHDYVNLIRSMRGMCQSIENARNRYRSDIRNVLGMLALVLIETGKKYGKITKLFDSCGLDINKAISFFDKWIEQTQSLENESKRLESDYKTFSDYFSNVLAVEIRNIPQKIDEISHVFGFAGFAEEHLKFMLNQAYDIYMPTAAVTNAIICLGHIGTYCNGMCQQITAIKNAFFDGEGTEYVIALHHALENSKDAWEVLYIDSRAFFEISRPYQRGISHDPKK